MAKHITRPAKCEGCGVEFGSRNRGGKRGWTRFCSNTCRGKTLGYKGGPAASRRRRRYGMEPGEYQAKLELQNGRCALCRIKPDRYPLYVDHNHETNNSRALLCARCNTAIGVFDALNWDQVLIYWGYSRHYEQGLELAEMMTETLGGSMFGGENGPTNRD